MHDRTSDYLVLDKHYKAGTAYTLTVRRQAQLACRSVKWPHKFEHNDYGYCEMSAEPHLVANQPKPGAQLIIRHTKERFAR